MIRYRFGEFLGLCARDGLERGFVFLGIPDFPVVARLAAGANAQDDAVEDQLPPQALILDHARIGKEFLQVKPHAFGVRGVGGAEIDQQHADAFRLGCRHRLCTSNGNDHGHDFSGFARCIFLVKQTAGSLRWQHTVCREEP